MSIPTLRSLGLVTPLILAAHTAHADVTAQQVWDEWKSYFTVSGYTVDATEEVSSLGLTVRDINLRFANDDVSTDMTLPLIELTENGDGSVNVSVPAEMPISFTVSPKDFNPVSGSLLYSHDGSPIVVSGDSTEMTYNMETDAATLALTEVIAAKKDGTPVAPDVVTFKMSLENLASNLTTQIGTLRSYTQEISASALTYDFGIKDPDGEGSFSVTGAMQGLNSTATSALPTVADPTDTSALVRAGLRAAMDLTFDASSGSSQFSEGSEGFSAQTSTQGGEITFSLGTDGLTYAITAKELASIVQSSELPFPLPINLGVFGMNLSAPLVSSEEVQDFALGVNLQDFAVPDMLWGMFDPTGELPHDPATIAFDLTGKSKLFIDLMDETQLATLETREEAPGELNALNLNSLLVSAVGAELTGSGAFTFDNSDLETFDGMPAPDGAVDLQLVGANALLDKLVALGFVTEDDAMGARMMMGMFTVPGEGEDTLTSKIEVKSDGQLLANGQRLR